MVASSPLYTQMALSQGAYDTWNYIIEEGARRAQLLKDEELRAAIERSKPRSKKERKPKPWVSLGSEVRVQVMSMHLLF